MATSDNVVRAGLTPKFKDVQCLVDMLTYRNEGPDKQKFQGTADPVAPNRFVYRTPVPEFDVARVQLPTG